MLGRTLVARQQFADAIPVLQRAVASSGADVDTWMNFGVALIATKRLDEGIAAFRRAVELGPRRGDALRNLALALADRGDLQGARVAAERGLTERPADEELRALLALIAERTTAR